MNTKHTRVQFRILIILTVMLAVLPSLDFAAEVWTPVTDMPTPRRMLSCSVVDGKIYAIGGRSKGGGPVSTVEAYDPATNQWTTKASIPIGRRFLATSVVDGKIYAIGGEVSHRNPVSQVHAYDPMTDTWTRKADLPGPLMEYVKSGVVDGKIYAFGTADRPEPTTMDIYDPSTDSWTRGTAWPTLRFHPEIGVVDGKIYAIGGSSAKAGNTFSVVEAYDPATDTWTRKRDMPTPRSGLASAVVDGRIYAIGGFPDSASDVVEVYNPATDRWRRVPSPLVLGRSQLNAAVVDGTIYVMGGWSFPASVEAFVPEVRRSPADGAADVYHRPVLEWAAGEFAQVPQEYDVYFGTDYGEVSNAAYTDAAGPDSVYKGPQESNRFAVPGALAYGQTYYWRIDEIGGPPAYAVVEGDVWMFTTEALAYPIAPIAVTSSGAHNLGTTPETTIDGSGLNALDLHGDGPRQSMWLSEAGVSPAWIQYEFDRVYKLHEMWVWNYNRANESISGLGAKDVSIDTSFDGQQWTPLENVPQFAQAPGAEGYAHNTTVDLGGRAARFVRLTIHSGWGPTAQYGLSEVRFFTTPTYARSPQPANGATIDSYFLGGTLQWRAGQEAVSHLISLSTDAYAVLTGEAVTIETNEAFVDLCEWELEYNTTYYWSVTEINDAAEYSSYVGDLWHFNTPR